MLQYVMLMPEMTRKALWQTVHRDDVERLVYKTVRVVEENCRGEAHSYWRIGDSCTRTACDVLRTKSYQRERNRENDGDY